MLRVKIEAPKKIRDDPDAIAKWERSVPVAMASALAHEIRERVQGRGAPVRLHTPANNPNRLVSPRYPGAGLGTLTRSGARAFRDDAAFRRAIGDRPGRFSPSSGMWDGSSVISRGSRAAENRFRGRSEGQDPGFFRYKSGRQRARGRKVSNALKAWTILEKTGVNVLELKDEELRAVEAALTESLGFATVNALGVGVALSGAGGHGPVYRTLQRLLAGRQ